MTDKKNISAQYVVLKGDAETQEAYRFLVTQKRRAIEKDWHLAGMPPKERARHKRAINTIVRRQKKYDKARLTNDDLILLLRGKQPSEILDYVYPQRNADGNWRKFNKRSAGEDRKPSKIDLESFSFLDAPEKCLNGIVKIAEYEVSKTSVLVNFKDSYCLDVAPYMLLTEFWSEMLPIFNGGKMDVPMQKVLAATGIAKDLKVNFRGIKDFDDVWAFRLMRRRKKGDSRSRSIYFDVPSRDRASDRFCDTLDDWLNRPEIGFELTQNGRGNIKELLGEILENAERHSDGDRRDGSWTVAGFLEKRKVENQDRFIAHIGILSLGDTFAKSLERATD